MHFQYIPYLWILFIAALITAALGIYAWQRRGVPGALPFTLLMSAATVWVIANGLEKAGVDLPTKLFWANVQYMVYGPISVLWLILVLDYTGQRERLTPRNLALLFAIPMLTAVVAWTNNAHELLRRDVYLDTAGPFSVVAKTYGPWFWIFLAHSYVTLMLTLGIFIRAWQQTPSLYRGQVLILMAGLLLPVIWNILYIFGLSPFPRHDIAPAIFALSGLLVAWGLFRYRLFNVTPVARATVIELMEEGVIVLDAQGQIVDINPAAQQVLGVSMAQVGGQHAVETFGAWTALATLCAASQEHCLESERDGRHYELHASPLGPQRPALGRLILLRDITERQHAQAQSLQRQRAHAVSEERARLAREMHDSLAQVLGYINVQVQAIQALLATQKTDIAHARLARLIQVVQDAQTDVREYIMNVTTTSLDNRDFETVLADYLQHYGETYDLAIEFEVTAGEAGEETAPIAPEVAVQLMRIVQEALANIRKHAAAEHVTVSLTHHARQTKITLVDDGRGFNPTAWSANGGRDAAGRVHFGLRVMRERAQAVGGSLTIEAAPGQGTRVEITMPPST
ncbi:MAG: histidine kinase N-terminal 7TM domain-containing protein [Anaerolineales bacterium]